MRRHYGTWSSIIQEVFDIKPKIKNPSKNFTCLNCSKISKNPKFCCRSCSVSFNNKKEPKRKRKFKICPDCKCEMSERAKKCKNCFSKDISLQEAIYTKHHKSSAFALVRFRARKVGEKLKWEKCACCNYSKHIEIAHIIPVSNFDKSTMLSVINQPNNLLPLCPNCHWEFDAGLLPHLNSYWLKN